MPTGHTAVSGESGEEKGWPGEVAQRGPQEQSQAGPRPPPSLTDGCHEVHGDLVRGQGPLPDDELIESSVLVALGLVRLRSYHEVDVGLPVGMRHFPIGV